MTGAASPMTLTFPSTSPGPRPLSVHLKFYIYSAKIAVPLRVILIPVFHKWFHDVLLVVNDALLVVHDVLQCRYHNILHVSRCFTMFNNVL